MFLPLDILFRQLQHLCNLDPFNEVLILSDYIPCQKYKVYLWFVLWQDKSDQDQNDYLWIQGKL